MIKVYFDKVYLHIVMVGMMWSIFREKTSFIEQMKIFCNSFSCYKVT